MSSLKDVIYFKCPDVVQNVLVSIYGYRIDKIRHGKQYCKMLENIEKRLYYTEAEIKNFQEQSLRCLIRSCAQNVPYYKEMFKKNGVMINDDFSINDLKKISILEKTEIRKNTKLFINNNYKKSNLINIHTTGTTGTPLDIYCNTAVRQANYAFYDRFLRNSGIDYKKSRATFGGRIIMSIDKQNPPFWRYSHFQKNLLFSSYHLKDENIQYYIEKLYRYRPHYIDSYPSSIFAIAKYAKQHSIDLKGLTEGITTSAETLFDDQRMIIEEVFGVPVIDQYGAAEMCVFIGQCAHGSYHVHTDYSIVEFLREDGSQAMAGEEAEVVCTGLINEVMPLIRYRIGDKVVVSDKKCTCECTFPIVEKVIGRIDDDILTPEGNRVGRLSPVLKGFPVKKAQYLQKSIDTVTLLLVPDDGFSADIENEIIIELRKRLGNKINIHVEQVERIERGAGGKFKSVISTLI